MASLATVMDVKLTTSVRMEPRMAFWFVNQTV
jgi:hypothetical protein